MNHKKGYATPEEAMRSKAYLNNPGATVNIGCLCGMVHVDLPKATPRGTGPSTSVRELVLERDGYACVCCGRSVIGWPYSIHHRKRRSQGGRHTPENLITLCGSGTTYCHGHVHAHIGSSLDLGRLLLSTQDPAAERVRIYAPPGVSWGAPSVYLTPGGLYATEPPEVAA